MMEVVETQLRLLICIGNVSFVTFVFVFVVLIHLLSSFKVSSIFFLSLLSKKAIKDTIIQGNCFAPLGW